MADAVGLLVRDYFGDRRWVALVRHDAQNSPIRVRELLVQE